MGIFILGKAPTGRSSVGVFTHKDRPQLGAPVHIGVRMVPLVPVLCRRESNVRVVLGAGFGV